MQLQVAATSAVEDRRHTRCSRVEDHRRWADEDHSGVVREVDPRKIVDRHFRVQVAARGPDFCRRGRGPRAFGCEASQPRGWFDARRARGDRRPRIRDARANLSNEKVKK